MSLLLFNGEVIEIPEYIIRIVKRAQEIVSSESQYYPLRLSEGGFHIDDSEPTVLGPDGCTQTVSEYILGIIRTAQKIVQDDPRTEEDIRDYDQFIDYAFDAMLSEEGINTSEESVAVVQDVVEKLIDDVCSSPKFKMPEMESSVVSTTQEDIPNSLQNPPEQEDYDPSDAYKTEEQDDSSDAINAEGQATVKSEEQFITGSRESDSENQEHVEQPSDDSTNEKELNEASDLQNAHDEIKTKVMDVSIENVTTKNENLPEIKYSAVTDNSKTKTEEISTEELEKIAEKFVEDVCNEVKNELKIEQENKANEMADSNIDNAYNEQKTKDEVPKEMAENIEVENRPVTEKEVVLKEDINNGQIDQTGDNKVQNHTSKVHPEEAKPVVTNLEDISDNLPAEGKRGKGQKYDVSKDKIKPKRRSRGLRNSFRRMFSCFSTKSSQLE